MAVNTRLPTQGVHSANFWQRLREPSKKRRGSPAVPGRTKRTSRYYEPSRRCVIAYPLGQPNMLRLVEMVTKDATFAVMLSLFSFSFLMLLIT